MLVLISLLGFFWTASYLLHASHVQHSLGEALAATRLELKEAQLSASCELPLTVLEPDVLRLELRLRDQGMRVQQLEAALRKERSRSSQLLGAKASAASLRASAPLAPSQQRPLAFVGVSSHPSRMAFRTTLRESWFPTGDERRRLEEEDGLVFRFLVGVAPPDEAVGGFSAADAAELGRLRTEAVAAEQATYGDMLFLEHTEQPGDLSSKTLLAFEAATAAHDASYYVKVDDDVWLSPSQLAHALRKRMHLERVYLGCMRDGSQMKYAGGALGHMAAGAGLLFSDPDPSVLPFAAGQAVALSSELVQHLVSSAHLLQRGGKEDVTIGSWLFGLAHSAVHDPLFCCSAGCSLDGEPCVAVSQPECAGVCEPQHTLPALAALCNATGDARDQAWLRSGALLRAAADADALRAGRSNAKAQPEEEN